ncbi:MAG TPA: RluA family pseudouridine synthase [Pyrinomonadaceae bacterium]|jgi:23S rRNA pseudouridine1911/1915/1917 synthase
MESSIKFYCDSRDAGQRLDVFLAARLASLSRMRIARLLAAGACVLNGTTGAAGQKLSAGDHIEIALGAAEPTAMTPERLPLKIVYEDDELLVVDKPAGLLVHPTRAVKTGTLANALTYHLNRLRLANESVAESDDASTEAQTFVRPGLVHRLDRATSGLLVVAKTQRALSILTRHFHERRVEKRYLALVRGRVRADECEIEAPIGRDADARPQWRVLATGRAARTRLRVLARGDAVTFVELEPVTGRTNQLRIHCAHAGHAIVGDAWYGPDSLPDEREPPPRLCLHAARLAFHHPTGGRWLEFVSPLPEEIAAPAAGVRNA